MLWGADRVGCRRLITLVQGLPAAAATWDRDRAAAVAPESKSVTPSEFAGLMSQRRR